MLTLVANGADTTSSVWPSPGAFATRNAARLPIAPAWLSTRKGRLKDADSAGTMMRARMSLGSPGDAPTTTCTVLAGYSKYAQPLCTNDARKRSAAPSVAFISLRIYASPEVRNEIPEFLCVLRVLGVLPFLLCSYSRG